MPVDGEGGVVMIRFRGGGGEGEGHGERDGSQKMGGWGLSR